MRESSDCHHYSLPTPAGGRGKPVPPQLLKTFLRAGTTSGRGKGPRVPGSQGLQDPLSSGPQSPTHTSHLSTPPCPTCSPENPKVARHAAANAAIGGAPEHLGPGGRCGARDGARGTPGSAREAGSAGTKARRNRDPRRMGPGLTPRRHTLSSRIAIMCSGSGRARAQQHRPGRTAPSLRPAVS